MRDWRNVRRRPGLFDPPLFQMAPLNNRSLRPHGRVDWVLRSIFSPKAFGGCRGRVNIVRFICSLFSGIGLSHSGLPNRSGASPSWFLVGKLISLSSALFELKLGLITLFVNSFIFQCRDFLKMSPGGLDKNVPFGTWMR